MSSSGRRFYSYSITFSVLGSVFYIFDSGLPQPADFYLLLVAISYIYFSIGGRNLICPTELKLFVFWIAVVAMYWAISLQGVRTLQFGLMYLFNLAVFVFYIQALPRLNCFSNLFYGMVLAAVALLFGLVFEQDIRRASSLFNNPNQLAYFCLCGSAIIYYLHFGMKAASRTVYFSTQLVLTILLFVSGSFGGIAGFIFVAAGVAIQLSSSRRVFIFALIFGLVVVTPAWYFFGDAVLDNIFNRSSRLDEKVNNILIERSINRVYYFPEYILLGAGEGELWRFAPYNRHEIHNSFATLIFSYGLIGISLFLVFLYRIARRLSLADLIVFVGPFVYSLTHQGLRFTIFWIFLAVVYIVSVQKPMKKNISDIGAYRSRASRRGS